MAHAQPHSHPRFRSSKMEASSISPTSSSTSPASSSTSSGPSSLRSPSSLSPPSLSSISMPRLLLLMLNNAGVILGYAAQGNLGSSELLRHGVSESHLSLVFLAGPISGLLVQPMVGYLSDVIRQRRPFILTGAILVSLSLLAMGCAANKRDAIIAFFALDMALQAVQAPVRAMIADALPRDTRKDAMAQLSAFGALGGLMSGMLASRKWTWLKGVLGVKVDAQVVLILSAVLALVTMLPCACMAPEGSAAAEDDDDDEEKGEEGEWKTEDYNVMNDDEEDGEREDEYDEAKVKLTFLAQSDKNDDNGRKNNNKVGKKRNRHASGSEQHAVEKGTGSGVQFEWFWPRPFWQTFLVQLCTWSGFFAMSVYANAWIGTVVFGGDGTAAIDSEARLKFDAGVRLGAFSQALSAVISLIISVGVMPRLVAVAPVYLFAQGLGAAVLLTPLLLGERGYGKKMLAVIAMSSYCIVGVVANTVPWLILAEALHKERERCKGKVGVYSTVFNASQALPQLILGLLAPLIMEWGGGRPRMVMATAGFVALLGVGLIKWLRVDRLADGELIQMRGRAEAESVGYE